MNVTDGRYIERLELEIGGVNSVLGVGIARNILFYGDKGSRRAGGGPL